MRSFISTKYLDLRNNSRMNDMHYDCRRWKECRDAEDVVGGGK